MMLYMGVVISVAYGLMFVALVAIVMTMNAQRRFLEIEILAISKAVMELQEAVWEEEDDPPDPDGGLPVEGNVFDFPGRAA